MLFLNAQNGSMIGQQAFGAVSENSSAMKKLLAANMDPGVLRPWMSRKTGRSYITLNDGINDNGEPKTKNIVVNAPATLTKDQWIQLDEVVLRAARPQLRVWADLEAAGLTYNIPNGMGITTIQHQTMTDAGEAAISMDALRKTNRDRPVFDLVNLPLPITHGEFGFSMREILVSRGSGAPLDTTMAEQTARRISELTESLTLGTAPSYTYGGGTIYGLTNYPDRLTTVMTLPTDAAWTPELFINEILGMVQGLQDDYFNGPYGLWYSPGWTKYLDADYAATYGGETLRTRMAKIEGINWARKADQLGNFQVILVQLTSDVIQTVTGMPFTTVQWEEDGGLAMNFKILTINIPRIRSNSDGDTGINHGTAA